MHVIYSDVVFSLPMRLISCLFSESHISFHYLIASGSFLSRLVPEDNVESLRNIRDMFENPAEESHTLLHKIERHQPSEGILKRLNK